MKATTTGKIHATETASNKSMRCNLSEYFIFRFGKKNGVASKIITTLNRFVRQHNSAKSYEGWHKTLELWRQTSYADIINSENKKFSHMLLRDNNFDWKAKRCVCVCTCSFMRVKQTCWTITTTIPTLKKNHYVQKRKTRRPINRSVIRTHQTFQTEFFALYRKLATDFHIIRLILVTLLFFRVMSFKQTYVPSWANYIRAWRLSANSPFLYLTLHGNKTLMSICVTLESGFVIPATTFV